MIRRWLAQFMVGRYGADQLNVFLMVLYILFLVLFLCTKRFVFDLLALVLIVLSLYRALSRSLDRRRAENSRFLQIVRPAARRYRSFRSRARDKEHRYFKCPNCGQLMRVPKGKGRITVHCRTCGITFEEKS